MSVSTNQKYAIASVLVIALSVIIDHVFLANEYPSTTIDKRTSVEPPTPAESINDVQNLDFRFENISLPPPPSPPSSEPSQTRKVVSNKPINKSTNSAIQSDEWSEKQYSQLTGLSSSNLRLTFPDDYYSSMRILRYLHECVGVGIGAYNGLASKTDLILLSGARKNNQQLSAQGQYSKIVRLASGIQTQQEKGLLQAYAPGQQLVRLYPIWFDQALSSKIARQIGGQALSQLSGIYVLNGNTLYLDNISLNHQVVQGKWKLAHNILCGA